MTANLNADTEYQNLLNEYQQLINEARQDTNDWIGQETANKIDSIKKLMALRELQHQKDMVAAQDSLEMATERLRVALRNIALYSQSLTPAEKEALENATKAYEIAFEKVATQTEEVFKAQQAVHAAEIALAKADKEIDDDYQYVDALEYYKRKLALAEASALLNGAALLAIGYNFDDPEDVSGIIIPEDLAEWQNQIAAFEDSIDVLDYNKASIITEIANYYVANIHDGVAAFNNAVAEFGADNDLYTDDPSVDPRDPSTWDNVPEALTEAEADTLSWGEPKQDDFKQSMDTIIVFPDLLDKDFNIYTYYLYYATLLSSYDQESPVSKATTNNEIIIWKSAAVDTIRIQKANQSMKAFILGADGDGDDAEVYTWEDEEGVEHEIKANYGLKGALSVLKRIYKEEKAALDPVETAKAKKLADSVWTAHNGILKAGLTAYAPYTTAISDFTTAKSAAKPDAMFTAMKELFAQIKTIDGQKDINAVDSTAILAAIEKFAKARDAYLDDANNGTGTNYKYAASENPHFFYFATKTEGGKAVVDSVSFTEIATQTKFDKAAYQWDTEAKDNAKEGTNYMSAVKEEEKGRRAALNNILSQLFKVPMTAMFNKDASTPMPINVGTDVMRATDEVIPGSKKTYTVDSWEKPTKLYADGAEGYEPAAVTTAADKVYEAIGKYYAVYNAYWNPTTALPTAKNDVKTELSSSWSGYFAEPKAATLETALTGTFAKFDAALMNQYSSTTKKGDLKANTYTAAPFDAFTKDEAPLVLFASSDILETDALAVVLSALDPKGWTMGNDAENSAIFNYNGTKGTDFYNRMKARYNDWLANHPEKDFEQDTKTIEKWIAAVEHAFALDAEKAGMPDEEGYEAAKAAYDRVSKKSKDYDAYVVKKKAFTGEDEDGNANEIVVIANDYDEFSDFFTKDEVSFELAAEDPIYEVYTGKWIKALGGKQLEIANTLFPKLPENMKEWEGKLDAMKDSKSHLNTLKDAYEKAYKAAAKAKYDVTGTDLDNLIENLQKQVVADFAGVIAAYEKAVGTETVKGDIQFYTEAIRDYDENVHVGKVHPAELALVTAQKTLAIENARLQGYQEVLAYAKANLDKILEYIKSLDVNFVVVTDQDIQNQQPK
jgi:hypothetical protein